jgi:FkbM family methyltransferase
MYISFQECIKQCGGQPFKCVIHVGAHYGEEALDYKNCGVEKIIWFEACRDFMSTLYSHTQKVFGLNQQYFNECLSDVLDEEIEFNIANNGQSSSMLELGTHAKLYPHISFVKKVKMKTKRFDKLMESQKMLHFEEYDFINLDVQGAELKVLKGFGDLLTKPNIRAIYTEINTEKVYKDCCLVEEIDDYLNEFGFNRILTKGECSQWGDALYFRGLK